MNTVYTVVLVVGLITLSMLLPGAFRTIAAAWRKRQHQARRRQAIAAHVLRRWHEQIPGLERIALCPDCRVLVRPDATTERIPCQWHADIRSVAIERQYANGGQG